MFWIYDVNANGPWNSEKTVHRHLEMLKVLKTGRWVNNKVPYSPRAVTHSLGSRGAEGEGCLSIKLVPRNTNTM